MPIAKSKRKKPSVPPGPTLECSYARNVLDPWTRKLVNKKTAMEKYEEDIIKGKIPCPYAVEHRDGNGNLIANCPLPINRLKGCRK